MSCSAGIPNAVRDRLLSAAFLLFGFLALHGAWPGSAQAHGPLFGWGPRTIWANGYAVGVELETDVTALQAVHELGYHFGYGITEDW